MCMKINNRRYIGCKTKLLDFIESSIDIYNFEQGSVFADIFAGTGVVGYQFAQKGFKTILNDILYSNVVVYKALLGEGDIDLNKVKNIIEFFNEIDSEKLSSNYFSEIYGKKYFAETDAKKIGYIRDYIEDNKNKYTEREYYYLISSLLYSCDKIANTVGHFESFLKKEPKEYGVKLELFELPEDCIPADIYNMDANDLSRIIHADVVYIDPPYNASMNNLFETSDLYFNAAESYGKWRRNTDNYEKIQGILVDVRYLMHNYLGNHDEDKRKLAEAIEQYFITH